MSKFLFQDLKTKNIICTGEKVSDILISLARVELMCQKKIAREEESKNPH